MREAEEIAGDLVDKVGIGGVEKRHVPLQSGSHGLQRSDLPLLCYGALDQSGSR
jgi:hypothetical protein